MSEAHGRDTHARQQVHGSARRYMAVQGVTGEHQGGTGTHGMACGLLASIVSISSCSLAGSAICSRRSMTL